MAASLKRNYRGGEKILSTNEVFMNDKIYDKKFPS